MVSEPEFLICVECESPTYIFDWKEEKVSEALCEVCGNDDTDTFLSQQDWEEMIGG